ncbi:hypothetical protein GCM10027398_05770 [Azotobacter salinestris]
MGGGGGNQVGEAFEGDGVAIVDEALYRFTQGEDFGHFVRALVGGSAAPDVVCSQITDKSGTEQSDNRQSVRLSNDL